jgi:hypothetical protein
MIRRIAATGATTDTLDHCTVNAFDDTESGGHNGKHPVQQRALGQDLARIEKALGYRLRSTRDDAREQTFKRVRPYRERSAASKRRRK